MLTIDLQSRQPIYEQLIYRMSELVALGALAPGEQLPSVRALARSGHQSQYCQRLTRNWSAAASSVPWPARGVSSPAAAAPADAAHAQPGNPRRARKLADAPASRAQALETVEYVYKEANV